MKIYLQAFENKLQQELLRLLKDLKLSDGKLLANDDIDGRWESLGPEYLADAVLEIRDYPAVSVGWAAYLGMAVAQEWDTEWEEKSKQPYKSYHGSRGFDDMDEHILADVLGMPLNGSEAKALEKAVQSLAQKTVSMIRAERVEPRSVTAYHVFMKSSKVMYRIGAAIRLRQLGYKYEKLDLR